MGYSNFFTSIYHFASPSHRRAARQRRAEYKAEFERYQEENAKRVNFLSQMRGHADPAAFLYDSAWGTGASASASRYDLHDTTTRSSSTTTTATSMSRSPSLPQHQLPRARPFSMISDYSSSDLPTPLSATGTGSSSVSAVGAGFATPSSPRPPSLAGSAASSAHHHYWHHPFYHLHGPADSPPPYHEHAAVAVGPAPPPRRPRPMSVPLAPRGLPGGEWWAHGGAGGAPKMNSSD